MIVYSATKKTFVLETQSNAISSKIEKMFIKETGYRVSSSEVASWNNSMQFMKNVLEDDKIPGDAGIAIEYKIPQTAKRIDFIITGIDQVNKKVAILIELKQWSEGVRLTTKDAILEANFYAGREINHPSYQAWSYACLLKDFNSNVQDKDIQLKPCAYLHNYPEKNGIINDSFYSEWTTKAPVFFRDDVSKLSAFIKNYVKTGDQGALMYEIENGKIRPSKQLADSLGSMLAGNQEFIMIDDQKIVYETALDLAEKAKTGPKQVLIVEGGPGTGKSVVAINLLVDITKNGLVTQYVTKNSAPREVYAAKLTGLMTKSRYSNMFKGSGAFYDAESNTFDALVVDEAHRLNEKSGLFSNKGENQIKEIINASKCSIFFVDESQKVTLKDIGDKEEIERWATRAKAEITNLELTSQFRCNGSDGYLAWLDDILGIRETANEVLDTGYDFQVIDSPAELHKIIRKKNHTNNKSRVVAGYCWNWNSSKDANLYDINIGDYKAKWNLKDDGQSWIIKPNSVSEVGCIHTCQGLELDYVGVIIGEDLIVRNGMVITDVTKRSTTDNSVKGWKKKMREEPDSTEVLLDMIIKNTYRTLMTRGMKGCYIYCVDQETQEYFKKKLESKNE